MTAKRKVFKAELPI